MVYTSQTDERKRGHGHQKFDATEWFLFSQLPLIDGLGVVDVPQRILSVVFQRRE